jgi:Membrane bound FAD containing D-sorbitol dehydrogenase
LIDLTRRNILTGAAATAAGAAASTNLVAPAEAAMPAPAAPSTANATPAAPNAAPAPFPEPDPADLKNFVALSSGLTGISTAKLAPAVDPIQIKRDYFNAAKFIEKPIRGPNPDFPKLMDIIRGNPGDPAAAAAKVMNNPDARIVYLGRSIILAWYLGVWYDPDVLKIYNTPPDKPFPVPVERVISPAAYTQGWTWRVAQAHPMGYSEMRFGYWAQDALPLSDYIA